MMMFSPQKNTSSNLWISIRIISHACQLKTCYSGHLKVKVINFYPFQPRKKKLHFAKAHQEPRQVSLMEALLKGLKHGAKT
jgi:hypothetical protein